MTENAVIAGIDEVGRGSLAGPVVAAACVIRTAKRKHQHDRTRPTCHRLIRDSKQLTAEEREQALAWIEEHCLFGVGIADAEMIDARGILAATEMAMQAALRELEQRITPTYLLVDGRDAFWFDYPHSSIIRGDETEPCISAASIVAKVTRDRMMRASCAQYPHYGFSRHKGYGAPEHIAALHRHGPCPLHRMSYIDHFISVPAASAQTAEAR